MLRQAEMRRVVLLSVLSLAVASGGSGCTDGDVSPSVPPSFAPSIAVHPSATPTLSVAPPVEAGMTRLVSVAPRSGAYAANVSARKGTLWVLLHCLNGKVTIMLEGIAEMPFTCSVTEIKTFAAEIEIVKDEELSVKVEPSQGNVVWALTLARS